MKKSITLFCALGLFALPLHAQQPEAPTVAKDAHAVEAAAPDPSAAAMRESQHLQKALGLDARQTRKVYKLYYSHFKKSMSQRPSPGAYRGMAGRSGGPGRPGGPGMGPGRGGAGMHPGGPGRMDGMGRRPEGDAGPGEHRQPAGLKSSAKDLETWRKTQEKKFRKIFTDEQYTAWQHMQPVPPAGHPDAAKERPAAPRP